MTMHFAFEPLSAFRAFRYSVAGDVLTVNDQLYDLAPLPEGGTLPRGAVPAPWLLSDVTRDGGVLHLRVVAAGTGTSPASIDVEDGPVALPDNGWPAWSIPAGLIDWTQLETSGSQEAAAVAAWRKQAILPVVDFAIALMKAGIVTKDEALAWATGQALPAVGVTAIATLPEAVRDEATIRMLGSPNVARGNNLVALLAGHMGLSDAQVDALFAGPSA